MPRKQEFQPKARLGWTSEDGEFSFEPHDGPNRRAAGSTVTHLRELGRLEVVDTAVTTAFEMLAEAVDSDPTNAALWGQYRACESALRGLGDGDTDPFAKFLAELSAPAGDAPDESTDEGRQGGKGRGGVRSQPDAVAAVRGGRRKRAAP